MLPMMKEGVHIAEKLKSKKKKVTAIMAHEHCDCYIRVINCWETENARSRKLQKD